jgi:hypothetical protein
VLADKSGRPISVLHLAPGQVLTGNDLWFTPEGAISGKVIGPDGEPLPAASVTLIERKWRRGKRVYIGMASADTDDAGVFHFAAVPPGRYWVYAARPTGGPLGISILEAPGKPETRIAGRYHPNAAQLDGAEPVEVRAGEEVSGIDFKLPSMPVFHIAGTYPGAGENIGVGLKQRHGDQMLDWAADTSSVGKDGRFEIGGVSPGSYFLYSSEQSRRDVLTGAKLPVEVTAQDIAGLAAPVVGRFEVKGRVRVDGDSAPDKIPVVIFYEGSEADDYSSFQRRAQPQPDGTFTIANLTSDRYYVRIANLAGNESGYYLKSLRVNGVDVAGHEIDLTGGPAENVELILNAAGGGVEGTVVRPEERWGNRTPPETGESIALIVPEKLASGATQPVDAYLDSAGHFQVTDLEPGSYRVFAVTQYDKDLWQSAEFLRRIAGRGIAVEVAEKATAKVEVHTVSAADVRQAEAQIE